MKEPEILVASKFTLEFNLISQRIEKVYVAVGMITDRMFDFAMRKLRGCDDINIVVGVHMATPPDLMKRLKEYTDEGKIKAQIFLDKYFHAKLYIFQLQRNSWIAFVGSGNFTSGGWMENEELFVKITDPVACKELLAVFDKWAVLSRPITDKFIDIYSQSFVANAHRAKDTRKSISDMIDSLTDVFNIENIDFRGQFFSKDDHLAFQPGITHLDTKEVLDRRMLVRNKLYRLNELVSPLLPRAWAVHPHYIPEYIVSHIETKFHHEFNVKGLWVGYGRNKEELKKYGNIDATPLHFMRMQVIIRYDSVGIWLMPGKEGGGQIDREWMLRSIEEPGYLGHFYNLLTNLGENYWIEVAGEERHANAFGSPQSLKDFLLRDNWRYYYLTLGRDYAVGSPFLLENRFVSTVIEDFTKFQPLYELIRDKSFG